MPPGCVMVPAVAEVPSPQLMLAPPVPVVKSVSGAAGLASVKLATGPENEIPSVALTAVPLAVKAASAIVAVAVGVAVLPPLSVMVIVTVCDPSSA